MLHAIAITAIASNFLMGVVLITGFRSLKLPYMKLALALSMTAATTGILCALTILAGYGTR